MKTSLYTQELFDIIIDFEVMNWKGQLTHQPELTIENYIQNLYWNSANYQEPYKTNQNKRKRNRRWRTL